MRKSAIYIILIAIVFGACSRRPSSILPESKMMDVLYDIRMVQAIYGGDPTFNTDQKKDALVAGVLEKHKITQAELDSSLMWYAENIDNYRSITDSVSARLRRNSNLATELKTKMDSRFSKSTGSVIPPFYNLTEYTPTLSFEIDSFQIKDKASNFHLSFDVQGLKAMQKAEAAIFYTYRDTLIRNVVNIDENKYYTLLKPQLPDSLLKMISGYIRIDYKPANPSNVLLYNITYSDSITNISGHINVPQESRPQPNRPAQIDRMERPIEQVPVPVKAVQEEVK